MVTSTPRMDKIPGTLDLIPSLSHAGVMAWCFRTISTLKDLELDHRTISIFDADLIRVDAGNPMRFVPDVIVRREGSATITETVTKYAFPAAERAREAGVTRQDEVWSTAYSVIQDVLRATIEMFVANETEIRFGQVWKLPRDRYGRMVRKNVDYGTVYHSQETVTEPKSLVGFMWVGLLEYLKDPSGIEFYECSGFDWCGQYLNKNPRVKLGVCTAQMHVGRDTKDH